MIVDNVTEEINIDSEIIKTEQRKMFRCDIQ